MSAQMTSGGVPERVEPSGWRLFDAAGEARRHDRLAGEGREAGGGQRKRRPGEAPHREFQCALPAIGIDHGIRRVVNGAMGLENMGNGAVLVRGCHF